MNHLLRALPALILAASAATGQNLQARAGKMKSRIDGLVRELAKEQPRSAIDAARFLVALARCPRHYDRQDGPLVRRPITAIWSSRRRDGLWGKNDEQVRGATAWVYQALEQIDDRHFRGDLEKIKADFSTRFSLQGGKLDEALHPYSTARFAGVEPGTSNLVIVLLTAVAKWEVLNGQIRLAAKARPWQPFQQKGLDWLMARQTDGIWRVPGPDGKLVAEPGTTALCLATLGAKPANQRTAKENETLNKGLKWLMSIQQKDGSFSTYLPNYMTCVAVMALAKSELPGTQAAMARAQKFLLMIQNVERLGVRRSDRNFGSIGYGNDERGDLSNMQMAIESLRTTGVGPDNEAIQKALVFIRRTQNLPGKDSWSGTRTTEDGKKVQVRAGDDGGSMYYPGNSPFGYDESSDGFQIARSYGSMTYALLKCYVLAGLPKDDPRLKAAINWCFTHFTLDENPGARQDAPKKTRYQGLYYYYLTLARALNLAGVDRIPRANGAGESIDWRQELHTHLKKLQNDDGSWVNGRNGRWWEDSPLLCTAYALLALSE